MTWANFNKYLIKILGSLLDQVVNVKLENCWSVLATLHYLFKSILISWKTPIKLTLLTHFHWPDYHQQGPPLKVSNISQRWHVWPAFLMLSCRGQKVCLKKEQKAGLPTVSRGKSWMEAWNPNPTFSGGQRLFQSGSFYNIFLAWYLSEGNLLPEYSWVGEVKTQLSVCDSGNDTDRGLREALR